MDGVHDFISDLIDQKMIIDIEPDVRESLIEDLSELLMREINNAAIRSLPEDKAIELANSLENGSIQPEGVGKFMEDAGLDFEEIAFITMMQFRDLYLGILPSDEKANVAVANVNNDEPSLKGGDR